MQSRPRPLDLFFAHMGWPSFVTLHRDFPLVNFQAGVDMANGQIYVSCTDTRTGEIVNVPDDRENFPSGMLVAAFRLLCGPIPSIMADYSKSLNRRLDRGRGRRR